MVTERAPYLDSLLGETPVTMRPLKLFHGGIAGLLPGQTLRPPSITGADSCSDFDAEHCRTDSVYVTTDPREAAVYAALVGWGGRGDVYEVEPEGELESDPPGTISTGSYAVPAASVVAIVRRGVSLDAAIAAMRAFLRECAADADVP